MNKKIIKIGLVILLLLCLLEMPYWYYQLLRIFGTIGFAYLSWKEYEERLKLTPILFAISAILLNPIIKISFDRNTWQFVDIILATILFITLLFEKKIQLFLKNKPI